MSIRLCRLLLVFVSSFMLSSCLDYEEEMIIHEDLSGEAKVTIHLPDSILGKFDSVATEFTEDKLRKRFDLLSGVKLTGYQYTEGRKPVVTLQVKFTSLEKLSEAAAANKPAGVLVGQFTMTKEGGNVIIERKLGGGEPVTGLPEFNFANYTTHFDGAIAKTNSGFHNAHNSDVRYRYKLTELIASQPVMRNEIARPLPWLLIVAGVIAALVGGWYGWKALKKKPAAP